MEQEFKSKLLKLNILEGEVSVKSPSNIALVKYWGKIENQLPTNSSISFTLKNSFTETKIKYKPKENQEHQYNIKVFLDNEPKESFVPKIENFFERIKDYFPFLHQLEFEIHTHNSFPHSSGIASSASGFSAIALCLLEIETKFGAQLNEKEFLKKASFISRLGSGSACRSIYKGLVEWGENDFIENSSDLYAVPLENKNVNSIFKTFRDTILLIHDGEKSVSSTVGHNLMNNHPYAKLRFDQANLNLKNLIDILASGDLESFGALVEHEAMSLHALMMMSNPAFILMQPNTIAALHKIWDFRKKTNNHLYFTLDAGANIHLLYPEQDEKMINHFIDNELSLLCSERKFIKDFVAF